MENNEKYPRTSHFDFSPGATKDDRIASRDDITNLIGVEIVATEKLDGQNSSFTRNGVYARSHTSEDIYPWSRNLREMKYLIQPYLSEDEVIYGENLYGIHSIEYSRLTSYYHLFAVRDKDRWYSWDEVTEFAEILNLPTVPELFRGTVSTYDELNSLVLDLMKSPSRYGDTKEGIVVRVTNGFKLSDFSKNVFKYVRANHVQTDEHWTKNWKKANLWIPEN